LDLLAHDFVHNGDGFRFIGPFQKELAKQLRQLLLVYAESRCEFSACGLPY